MVKFYLPILLVFLNFITTDIKALRCDGNLTVHYGLNGVFTSPNHENPYEDNDFCQWLLYANESNTLRLDFKEFFTESCCDIVRVYDGPADNYTMIGEFSGYDIVVPSMFSSRKELLVTFQSDVDTNSFGFKGVFNADPACRHSGGITITEPNGTIRSPYHPQTYANNQTCRWVIDADPTQAITLEFHTFKLEPPNAQGVCTYDYLEITDGLNVTVCCSIQCDFNVSTTNRLILVFRTDMTNYFSGFNISYYFDTNPAVMTTESIPVTTTTTTVAQWTGTFPDFGSTRSPLDLTSFVYLAFNGTAVTEGGVVLSPQCSEAYRLQFKDKVIEMSTYTTDNIRENMLCNNTNQFIVLHGSVDMVSLASQALVEFVLELPAYAHYTILQHHKCSEALVRHIINVDNWIQPIFDPISGCPVLYLELLLFEHTGSEWGCAY